MPLSYDVLLDQSAFDTASNDLEALCNRLETLHDDIDGMLTTLHDGFDTNAGREFANFCRENLMQPLNEQRYVLDHVSTVLDQAKEQYQPVFDAYADLNNAVVFE